jgi:2-C-methyl-D-erythritol 4-phosphate cytidylyltransferase / 2-C-methyl-D-erythritol 2,4-cyclodiphosphate synthase
MSVAAVIVAAGRGLRAGGGLPKQWRSVAGRAVAAWTVDAFRTSPLVGPIALVLHADDMDLAAGYASHPEVTVAMGGATRDASVRAGLEALVPVAPDLVLIHDVARPLVTHDLIARVVGALDRADAAAPALAVTDALWRGADGRVAGTVDRSGLWRAQTPQGFRFERILAAHRRHGGGAADDVEVARAAGLDVVIVPGEERNLKITTPGDFARAELLLRNPMDIRTGTGFDVHAFGPGDSVVLCGVRVPHTRGLVGHSDADVGMHALTDAIYGALAEGDIGRHFPPSDQRWKGADSALFLEHAVRRAAERGYRIANADVTLICERPKIGPHAADMQTRLEEIARLEPGRIGVKATTTETLGFAGREEGIAALASVTLVAR